MKFKSIIFLFILISYSSFSNKLIGFYPNWLSSASLNKIQYDKLTDIQYAFATPNSNGTYSLNNTGHLINIVANGHDHNVRVHVSIGGAAQGSTGWSTIAASASLRTTFTNNLMSLIQTYDLDGLNLDWEFPSSGEATNYSLLAIEIRDAMDVLEISMEKELNLSAAVSPLYWNNEGINTAFMDAVDELYLMAFDAGGGCCVCGGGNHSNEELVTFAYQYWTTGIPAPYHTCSSGLNGRGADPSKLIYGVPFYAFNTPYSSISQSDPEGFLNDDDGVYGGWTYNSLPVLERKVDLVNEYGGAGVFIWQIDQDRDDEFSLLAPFYDKVLNFPNGPTAKYSVSKTTVCTGDTVHIVDNSRGNITSMQWDFGIGAIPATATGSGPFDVIYTSAGEKTIDLIISSPQGLDQLQTTVHVADTIQLPFLETFDDFDLCETTANCGYTTCDLSKGWLNRKDDTIDWRVNSGSTPTDSTGPINDTTTGSGNYLYLESTNCFYGNAYLESPCIDLSGNIMPRLRFNYHMYGNDIGLLGVNVINQNGDEAWTGSSIVGENINGWQEYIVDLSSYQNQVIKVVIQGFTGENGLTDIAIDNIRLEAHPDVDCNGDFMGSAEIDSCGICSGGNTGLTPNLDTDNDGTRDCDDFCPSDPLKTAPGACGCGVQEGTCTDCNNDFGGTAYLDSCGVCVEGNTGNVACTQDCNNEYGGTATIDNCGFCAGGNTGLDPCEQDCNNEFGGTAYFDVCNHCKGGSTGQIPEIDIDNCILNIDDLNDGEYIIYPNPFQQDFIVSYTGDNFQPYEIMVYDIHGKQLLYKQVSTSDFVVNLDINNGLYFVKISSEKTSKSYKILRD